ncbi:hypothetical protein SPHINGOT1_10293 [Sphingomonas sp. T1]|nr:hypothetical protein SPHINGOT1_10293 [Sphingomonas sp. T1]
MKAVLTYKGDHRLRFSCFAAYAAARYRDSKR